MKLLKTSSDALILARLRNRMNTHLGDSVKSLLSYGEDAWTSDAGGQIHSLGANLRALDAFIRNHPEYGKKKLGLVHFNEEYSKKTLLRISRKRGRVSEYDEKILKSVILINELAGRDVTGHKKLLKITAKKSSIKQRPHIVAHSEHFRNELLKYCRAPLSKSYSFTDARDKALLAIILYTPLRLNTLHLLERKDLQNGSLYVPFDAMKTREAVNFPLPTLVLQAINQYLSLRSDENPYLFVKSNGDRVGKNAIYKLICRRSQKLLGQHLCPHDFRRIMATFVAAQEGESMAANLLVISVGVLRSNYDLSTTSNKLQKALEKLNGMEG